MNAWQCDRCDLVERLDTSAASTLQEAVLGPDLPKSWRRLSLPHAFGNGEDRVVGVQQDILCGSCVDSLLAWLYLGREAAALGEEMPS